MEKEKPNNQNKLYRERKEGYIIVTNYFLKKWVRVLGVGPVVLYQELLTYCHKEKYIVWPTIGSLCQQMGIAKTTLRRYQDTLIRFGLIKNITRAKSTTGHYRNNIYQITSLEELIEPPNPDKIIDFLGSKMKPDRYQNDTSIGSNMKLSLVSKRYPNNTNLNITKATTTNREKDAVVVAVNFKKLKEKGEEKMQAPCSSKEHYTGQAMREQLRDLDFEGKFIEQLLKNYSPRKIEKKLDLLMERKNIQRPAGWLMAALKNDYQGEEQESQLIPPPSRGRKLIDYPPQKEEIFNEALREADSQLNTPEWTSTEKAIKAINLIQDNLSTCISPLPSGKRTRFRKKTKNEKLISTKEKLYVRIKRTNR